jgi:hypothetical protein
MFCCMNDQTSTPIPSPDTAPLDPEHGPRNEPGNTSGHEFDHAGGHMVRPVQIGAINWIGLWTLYKREVQRFAKVGMQTVIAPVITSMLFLMVFAVAVGDRAQLAGDVSFIAFLVPGWR